MFPQPQAFRPERWIEATEQGRRLPTFNFSKGTRACLGIKYVKFSLEPYLYQYPMTKKFSLAYAELYLITAAVMRKFDFQGVDARFEDIWPYRDLTLGTSKEGYFGMKVKISKVQEQGYNDSDQVN